MTLGLEHEVFAFVPQTLAVKPKVYLGSMGKDPATENIGFDPGCLQLIIEHAGSYPILAFLRVVSRLVSCYGLLQPSDEIHRSWVRQNLQ